MQPALYLFFNGDCLEAMSRYAEVFGGEVLSVMKNADAARPEDRMPGGDDLVMHMTVHIGAMTVFASDTPSNMYQTPQGFRVQMEMPSAAEFDRVFSALSASARDIAMPPGETFWAERFTMFTDRFGTPWMLNFEGNKAKAEPITIETHVSVPPAAAWSAYTTPDAITQWNFASPDWCCPLAQVDLRAGGRHRARMEARDGSMGFDYDGVYKSVELERGFVLILDDGRRVETTFAADATGTRVRTVFDPDTTHPAEMQRQGWQAILDNYAAYVAAAKP